MANEKIVVQSHISRDFLQSAGLFKTDKLVVWEYVSNSLQYVEAGVAPNVVVTLDSKRKHMRITDNGRGMDLQGLQNFFVMHGENLDRKAGRRGRGYFGTGKSAAFGIADRLTVTSVRDGKRSKVELRRADVERAGKNEIPVRIIEKDTSTTAQNGTAVDISEIKLRTLDEPGIIRFVEKHLARWPGKPSVVVNNHLCEFSEPPVSFAKEYLPDQAETERLGNVRLTIKVAKAPLDPELQGVVILANGVWLETSLAGAEGQPMAQYIFGEIDVPVLDSENSSIPAFDMSRSMQLNRNNDVVQTVLAFVGRVVDQVRRQLVKEDQSRRAQEEAKKLSREASQIADIINQDFHEFSDRVIRVKAKAGFGRDGGAEISTGGITTDNLSDGGELGATRVTDDGDIGGGERNSAGGVRPPISKPVLDPDPDSDPSGRPTGGSGRNSRARGGFRVEFKELGADAPRATYAAAERTIYVNLEHPQIKAAKGTVGTEDVMFRRLSYEVAFCEYAIALASELATNSEYIEPSEPIFDIRETLNRMARRAAQLYSEK